MSDDVDVRKLLQELDEQKAAAGAVSSNAAPEPIKPTAAAQAKAVVNHSRPRTLYYRQFAIVELPACPRCDTPLVNEPATFMITVHQDGREQEPFIVSGQFGYFCPRCATIVVNPQAVQVALHNGGIRLPKEARFSMLGVLDLEAIPPSQRDLPLNKVRPLPLVPFNSPLKKKAKPSQSGDKKKKTIRKRR